MKAKAIISLASTLTLIFLLSGCYYDKEEVLYPKSADGCDTINITYTGHIELIMVNSCNGCHGGSFPQAGIRTDNYDDLKTIADNGKLGGTVNHESGFVPMPKDKPQLQECDLKQINIWIANNSPQ